MKKEEKYPQMSNFSIDHILNRAGQKTCPSYGGVATSEDGARRETSRDLPRCQMAFQDGGYHQFTFQWLNCTRYHPPKLQRGQKKEGTKRQPGRHPRIPFTAAQIEILEASYKRSAYLNTDEVVKLSSCLELSDTRIKIWFQNRRAREKREKGDHEDESNIVVPTIEPGLVTNDISEEKQYYNTVPYRIS